LSIPIKTYLRIAKTRLKTRGAHIKGGSRQNKGGQAKRKNTLCLFKPQNDTSWLQEGHSGRKTTSHFKGAWLQVSGVKEKAKEAQAKIQGV